MKCYSFVSGSLQLSKQTLVYRFASSRVRHTDVSGSVLCPGKEEDGTGLTGDGGPTGTTVTPVPVPDPSGDEWSPGPGPEVLDHNRQTSQLGWKHLCLYHHHSYRPNARHSRLLDRV